MYVGKNEEDMTNEKVSRDKSYRITNGRKEKSDKMTKVNIVNVCMTSVSPAHHGSGNVTSMTKDTIIKVQM